ncbi:unnamed protein product [Tilletia controversa]|uniref:Uncharacterized protein n=3 Tax=Tilletia TaxID=13289 RepID=A0A8X7SXZ3_9BASI|nr:hypothetical protein CF336_g3914 [Tilletia laevis]KAE8201301.1 hypothetical protein CF328_g2709 [Tilletia controversa]KAE8261449.1 hypothetical protein A4X03_0g3240 [Tilletia caries]KAE8203248.1 hypothetical protein CF335_g3105 [Tilletia laevis]KAE8250097.1 hypothetical protein A4X06_0g2928 [Tilletia controversa]
MPTAGGGATIAAVGPGAPPPPHPINLVFLVHVLLELPLGIMALFFTRSLPFLDMTNTTIVMLKLFGALTTGIAVSSLLVAALPDVLPCKRALVAALVVYHAAASTILLQAPRFIPFSLGTAAEKISATPENLWGCSHGFLTMAFTTWWQLTLPAAAALSKPKSS